MREAAITHFSGWQLIVNAAFPVAAPAHKQRARRIRKTGVDLTILTGHSDAVAVAVFDLCAHGDGHAIGQGGRNQGWRTTQGFKCHFRHAAKYRHDAYIAAFEFNVSGDGVAVQADGVMAIGGQRWHDGIAKGIDFCPLRIVDARAAGAFRLDQRKSIAGVGAIGDAAAVKCERTRRAQTELW